MNATLKAVCTLLRNDNVEVRRSAAIVLDRIRPRDPSVSKALGEALITCTDPQVRASLLEALQHNPHEQSIKFLLEVISAGTVDEDAALQALASIGQKVVAHLRKVFPKASRSVQRAVGRILPRIRSDAALAFLAEVFFNDDPEVIKAGVRSLREEMPNFDKRQKQQLLTRLANSLKDRRVAENQAALSAILISFGIIGDAKGKTLLLKHVAPTQNELVRRHALMSLARLEYGHEPHEDVYNALLPILEEHDYSNIVRYAVETLARLAPRRNMAESYQRLLANPHSGVQRYALMSLGSMDTVANVKLALGFLSHPDHSLREAASESLRRMKSAVEVILRQLEETTDLTGAMQMVGVLEAHGGRIQPERARAMLKAMCDLYEHGNERYSLYRHALLHLCPQIFADAVKAKAEASLKAGNFSGVRDYLRLFDQTPFMDQDTRFRLAVATLRTSRKEPGRASRQSDSALDLVARLLQEGGKTFVQRFFAEAALGPAEYYYTGFHFSERLNEERRFGADCLRHVIRKWQKNKFASQAREKLKVEGH